MVATVLLVLGLLLTGALPAGAKTVRQESWHLDALDIPVAHRITKGAGVVVAVIDSGVDAEHPALTGQVLPGAGFGSAAGDDGRHDRAAEGHGTSMAGLIAGKGGRANVMLGVAPQARILPVTLGAEEEYRPKDIADAIRWAVDHGAHVINLSLGGRGEAPPSTVAAVAYALSRNVVVVAAAGNAQESGPAVTAPGNIPGVIAVAGTDRNGNPWSGSGHGPEVVLAAPATEIISPVPRTVFDSGYAISEGTSAATAIVSGVAALVRSAYPELDAANVVNRLVRTATDLGPPGRDETTGFGMVNPVAALRSDVPLVTENPLGEPELREEGDTEAARGVERPQPDTVSLPDVDEEDTGRWVLAGGMVVLGLAAGVLLNRLGNRRALRRLAASGTGGPPPDRPPGWPPGPPGPPGLPGPFPSPDTPHGGRPTAPTPEERTVVTERWPMYAGTRTGPGEPWSVREHHAGPTTEWRPGAEYSRPPAPTENPPSGSWPPGNTHPNPPEGADTRTTPLPRLW